MVLLSARLGPAAIAHLLKETGADTILVSKRTKLSAVRGLEQLETAMECPLLAQVEPYTKYVPEDFQSLEPTKSKNRGIPRAGDRPGPVILHSSGTTGLPKPIRLSHRYMLSYAACHRLSPDESDGQVNLSTLPLYHVSQLNKPGDMIGNLMGCRDLVFWLLALPFRWACHAVCLRLPLSHLHHRRSTFSRVQGHDR